MITTPEQSLKAQREYVRLRKMADDVPNNDHIKEQMADIFCEIVDYNEKNMELISYQKQGV